MLVQVRILGERSDHRILSEQCCFRKTAIPIQDGEVTLPHPHQDEQLGARGR